MSSSIQHRIVLAIKVLMGKDISWSTPRETPAREIPSITAEEIAEARQFFPLEKFFIFGHARSGTTMLTRLIRLHPQVHCNYQAHFFTRPPLLQSLVKDEEVAAWLSRGSNRWNRGRDLSPVVLRAAADFILERDARREGKLIVGDKSPNSLLDGQAVRLVHRVYPDARLIYIVRDGRDAVISHRFQTFIEFPERLSREDSQIRDSFAQNPEPFLRGERSIFSEQGLRHAAEGWVRNVAETEQEGKLLYGEAYCSLRYEDMLNRPWEEMCRLWAFLGASPPAPELRQALDVEMKQNPDAEWQGQKAEQIARAMQKGRRGTWRELFTPRDRQIFHHIAGETLKSWGYEDTPTS